MNGPGIEGLGARVIAKPLVARPSPLDQQKTLRRFFRPLGTSWAENGLAIRIAKPSSGHESSEKSFRGLNLKQTT